MDGIVEGSVLRSGERVRITAQLIDASTDAHLWAESYERDLKDVLALQGEVARTIAGAVNVALTPQEQARLSRVRPVNPEAYEAYLKGTYNWMKLTPQGIEASRGYFERALEKDPSYALAYQGLAWYWIVRQQMGESAPSEAGPKAKAAALQAIALDEACAEAHEALAVVKTWTDWDWAGAEREWRRTFELNPNSCQRARLLRPFPRDHRARGRGGAAQRAGHRAGPRQRAVPGHVRGGSRQRPALRRCPGGGQRGAGHPARHGRRPGCAPAGLHHQGDARGTARRPAGTDRQRSRARGRLREGPGRGRLRGGATRHRRPAGRPVREGRWSARRGALRVFMPCAIALRYLDARDYDRALDWFEKAYDVRDPEPPLRDRLTHLSILCAPTLASRPWRAA